MSRKLIFIYTWNLTTKESDIFFSISDLYYTVRETQQFFYVNSIHHNLFRSLLNLTFQRKYTHYISSVSFASC